MIAFNAVAVFLFFALALVVPGGYSLGAALLLLASVLLLWKRPALGLLRRDRLLIAALLMYFFVNVAVIALHADPIREYDSPLRFLLAVPVLLLLLAYPIQPALLWAGLAVGALGGGLFVAWQHWAEGIVRPSGATNAIQYGNVSMLLGILCISGLGWALTQKKRTAWTILLLLGGVFGVLGSILTGSRGGWLAVPMCAAILCVHYSRLYGRRYLYVGLLAAAALIEGLYAAPQSFVKERTEIGLQELQSFMHAGQVETSVGERMEMWRSALAMSLERPVLGWGKQGFMNEKIVLIERKKITPAIGEYTNAHNEYLDALVKHGLLGLLALLGMYLIPLALFARQLRNVNRDAHPYALAGVCLITCYLIFGLTTTFLTLNIGVMMFVFPQVFLWSILRRQQNPAAHPASH